MGKKRDPETKLDDLRDLVAASEAAADEPKRPNRRGMLKMAGAALAGAAGMAAMKVVPASAADGGNFILGCANGASSVTSLAGPTANGTRALAVDGAIAVAGQGDAATASSSIGVLGTTKGGTGIGGQFQIGNLESGKGNYDLAVGNIVNSVGSGRLSMRGRGDVGAAAPNWNPNFIITNTLTTATDYQHELVRGNDGSIWASRAQRLRSGLAAQARWKKINTVRTDSSDGLGSNFKPFRVIDTRTQGGTGLKAPGTLNVVGVAGFGSGVSNVPSDAVAVMGNLTAVGYTGAGFLAIMPAGITIGSGAGQYNPAADPSSLNYIVGQAAIANAFVCGLHNGQLQVYVGLHSCYFIVDITAYLQ